MTKSLLLHVGDDGKPVNFNLKKLKRSHLLITGASGSGKSYFERVIAEQIVGRMQTFVIDPEGEYVTLREKFNFLLVGEGGEVPIHPRTAGVLAERLMKLGVSAIFDLSSMEVADQHLWVKNFVHALMRMHPKDTHDLAIIVDEAHLFCPEKGEGESVAKEEMLNLASRGRKRGFMNIWATQRLAKLANNAASELQNTCIGRIFLVNDRERAAKILGIPQRSKDREAFFGSLKVLDQGIFFALGVAISVDLITFQVRQAETRHPDPGERSSRRIIVPTPEQIKKLAPELAAIPVEVEEKEKTEKELRALVRELKTELAQAKRSQPAPSPAKVKEVKIVDSRLIAQAVKRRDQEWAKAVRVHQTKTLVAIGDAVKGVTAAGALAFETPKFPAIDETPPPSTANPASVEIVPRKENVSAPRPPRTGAESNGDLSMGEKVILIAISQYPDGAERDQLTVLTGYKRSTRDKYIQRLSEKQFVSAAGGKVFASDAGIEALGSDYEPLPQGEELQTYWLQRLPEGERKCLEVLLSRYPDAVPREALEGPTGYQRSTRDKYLQRLTSRRLVEQVGRGEVKAARTLFEAA